MKIRCVLLIAFLTVSYGCLYTFNGSSLPSYLKTVDIPLFSNKSLQPNVADEVTQELGSQVVSSNLLTIVQRNGDASLSGAITSYESKPFTYSTTEVRQVDVDQYKVVITADVEFLDNKKNNELYKGSVTGEGVFNFKTESEEAGRKRAEKDLVKRILENSVQSW
ncbi:MAG: LPS assembly lipoprotein LptE [Fibrobacterota bacterium]|nr:LptE family protein [Chitinispirillaceae bacterium]